jgi:hypothetical protein
MEFASLDEVYPSEKAKEREHSFTFDKVPMTDPDRPAYKRMGEVNPINRQEVPDELLDASEQFKKRSTLPSSLPSPKQLKKPETVSLPSYFGAEAFINPSEEILAPFNNSRDPNGFMLETDFTQTFEKPGLGKAGGTSLPVPELRNRWKHLSSDNVETASVDRYSKPSYGDSNEMKYMKSKIDALIARLDDIESRASGANPQLELLSFIMTGLFVIFMVDLAVRKSVTMKLR